MGATEYRVNDEIRKSGVDYFDPEEYLIDSVRRATVNEQNVAISLLGAGELIVLSTRGEYFVDGPSLEPFCRAPADQLEVTVLAKADPRILSIKRGRDIDELMWQAGFHASAGRLMDGCYRDDVIKLSHWPNLSRLPTTPNTTRLCAVLTRYPTSVVLIGSLLKVPSDELYQFYSAARCAGLAHTVNREPDEPALPPHRSQTLLSKLIDRIMRL
ncbi:hypothetical protein [Thiohalomonas denitrificans]|uniref:Uncharacterized protein n=1 Tax=Thiohalomonas denitrificans TaxID=415747 RepID=A0A1G5QCH1_9GAMM|nr:hypothetical protein [Thiohalomonas denitrificans]SCZ59286.1 hypothetical protein SAMN03097708_01831 [Thiohalomonas denitrificans]